MNKRRMILITLMIAGVLLAVCVSNTILGSNPGNPVSTALAGFSAQLYKVTHHPSSDYEIGAVQYDEKSERYCVGFSSAQSADSYFTLEYNPIGILVRNSYENRVEKRGNTAIRLSHEYNAAVMEALTAAPYPAEFLCTARLSWQHADGPFDSDHYIISDELELDGHYDLAELGAKAGSVWIRVEVDSPDDVSVEKLAETLQHIRKTLDQAGLPFYGIDCLLIYPNGTYTKCLDLKDFLCEDIFEEDLEVRLEEALGS